MNTLASLAVLSGLLSVASPDGRNVVAVDASTGAPHYQVLRDGEPVITTSRLGLELSQAQPFGDWEVTGSTTRTVDDRYPLVATKSAQARDHFNERTVSLRERKAPGRRLDLVLRAYDDGIAFRYVIPQQPGVERVLIRGEQTQFGFAGDYRCHAFNIGRMDLSHEGEFDPVQSSTFRNHHHYDAPLTCRTASGRSTLVLAEADLRDYAGMYLRGRGDGQSGVQVQLAFQYEYRNEPVRRTMTAEGVQTPWRVVMLADHAGQLIPSTLLLNLNPPNAIADTSWIKPGKAAWDWWSGPYLPPPDRGGTDMPTIRRYIDFAAQAKLEYMLIDEGWSLNSGVAGSVEGGADILKTKPGIDMPALVAYAKARNVGLMVWVQWSLLDAKLDEALALYEAWGLKGIKVDFMDRNDQEMVAFYHRVLRKAAEHHLVVDFHGAYPPTGLIRTWPNYLTQEGVMGAEYNKWSTRVTATHNVTIPYTRMLLGPIDYTPGGFRNRSPQDFRIVNSPPQVQTTRGQALAMYVVYDSPLQMVSDSPDAYAQGLGLSFISEVPTTWDETRFVAGEIGESIVLARRKGRDWYVGAMTNELPRTLRVPLDFLGPDGTWCARQWLDGATPMDVTESGRCGLAGTDVLMLPLAGSGGAAVRLTPAAAPRRRD